MKRAVRFLAAVAVAGFAAAASAQEYPSKPIRLLIPFPPGGGTDFVSRIVGNKLGEALGWTIVLENRPGAGGNIAIEAAAKSPADGYTIVMGQSDNMMLGPWLYKSVDYDTVKSFVPIVQVSVTPLAIVGGPSSKLVGPAEMIAKGKSSPGLSWATAGNGTLGHLFGEQLKALTGMQILQVPYKGAAPALTDVIGGQVDVAIMSVPSVLPQVKAGKLTPVAVTSAKRSPLLPNTPTLEEVGLKGVDVNVWLGLFAPAGTPPAVVAKLNAAVNKVLQMPDVREKIMGQGVNVVGGTSEDFAAFVKSDYARWGEIVKKSGVKVE